MDTDFEDIFGTVDTVAFEHHIPDASSGDAILRTYDQMREWAESIDCDVIEATSKQLFVDLDTEAQYTLFKTQIKLLKKHFYYETYKVTESKQGAPHRHVVVTMDKPYPLVTRIALQACLGSDPARELLSIIRAQDGEDNVVIFFEKKEARG